MNNAIIEFSKKHPAFFKEIVCIHYPFTFAELQQWQHWVDWHLIAKNSNIAWTMEMIDAFPTAPIAVGIAFCSRSLSNKAFLLAFCERFKNNKEVANALMINRHIVWDQSLFDTIGDYIDLEDLSFSSNRQFTWNYAIIDKYLGDWNWEHLSFNPCLPWSLAFIDRYKDYIDFDCFFANNQGVCAHYDIVNQYEDILNWGTISMSHQLPWLENNLLEKWHSKIDWTYIAANKKLLALPGFFETNISKWLGNKTAFELLSGNEGLPWDISLLEKYEDHWNWYEIADNENIPWSISLIEKYKIKLVESAEYEDNHVGVEKSYYRIANNFHFNIHFNAGMPWSIELLETFKNHWRFDLLAHNSHVWEKVFKPVVNAELIELFVKNKYN
jgi:hypothetical protein